MQQEQSDNKLLSKLAVKYNSNKLPKYGKSFLDFYELMYSGKRFSMHKVLEIGSGNLANNSLYMWREFFPNAKIYGINTNKRFIFSLSRAQSHYIRRGETEKLTKLVNKIGKDIDLVVDEGSSDPKETISTFQALMPQLNKNTTYIIENTNRHQAAYISENLKNYNTHIMRHSRMLSSYDRLIIVTPQFA